MLEEKIQLLKTRLKEQIELAKDQTTLSGLDYVAYTMIETIENDPIFCNFIERKVKQKVILDDSIEQSNKLNNENGKKQEKSSSFYFEGAWHEYYSCFKLIHDTIKVEKCNLLDIQPTHIGWTYEQCHEFIKERKTLYDTFISQTQIKETISYFEEFYNALIGLINSDHKLLIEVERENILKETDQKEPIEIIYNDNNSQCLIKYLDEEISFNGRRALIISFFYNNSDSKKTFHDFNAWKKNNKNRIADIDSSMFRQEIDEMNERLEKDSIYLSKIIELTGNQIKNRTKANFYKFKVKLKTLQKN